MRDLNKSMKSSNKQASKNLSNGKVIDREKLNNSEQEFEQILQELESPDYAGEGFWSLPENPTALEKSKYEVCQKILAYQQKHKLTDKEIAQRINLTTGETEDILFCRIDYFTLDRLMTYASRLFSNSKVKVIVEPKKVEKHARV